MKTKSKAPKSSRDGRKSWPLVPPADLADMREAGVLATPISNAPEQSGAIVRYTSRPFFGVYQKGRLACRGGVPRTACPYEDKRGSYHNMITFSKSFINFWRSGWDDEKARRPNQYAPKPKGPEARSRSN